MPTLDTRDAPAPARSIAPGLHVHLVSIGPTARFALWLESYLDPLDYKNALKQRRDEVQLHPGCLGHHERPAWLPASAVPAMFGVTLPSLGNGYPVPLPGPMLRWDVRSFNTRSRTLSEREYAIRGWLLPPDLSLGPLRRLLLDWQERHGAGFVAPAAAAVIAFIDEALATLREGPLLPTLSLPEEAIRDPREAWKGPPRPEQPLAWVPPVSLDDLQRLASGLAAAPRLGAPERDLARLARFLIEILDAAHRCSLVPGEHPPWTGGRLHDALLAGAPGVIALHREHESCLYPQHPIFAPPPYPQGHLAGRIDAGGAAAPPGRPLRLDLGAEDGDAWLPLRTLLARDALRGSALMHEDHVWFRPTAVIARDWHAMLGREPTIFCAPELLAEGSLPLSEAEAHRLLENGAYQATAYEMDDFLEREAPGLASRRRRAFTCFAVAPGRTGGVHLRVRWTPQGDLDALPEGHRALADLRFSAELTLTVGDRDLTIEEAEALLRDSTAPLLHAGDLVVYRASLQGALELARARAKVLHKLEKEGGGGVRWRSAIDLEDQWSEGAEDSACESIFAERWQAFLSRLAGGAGVPQLDAPEGFAGALRPYQARGLSWLTFLSGHGLGACLADDMGLGKTVQVLALLCARRAGRRDGDRLPPSLVVCPTSVVTNWAREAERFAPGLRVHVHQGPDRAREAEAFGARAAASDLVVTSFAVLRRDQDLFAARAWDVVVVDEAQNIKTPDAQQTRAVKALSATARIALTGTPVENRIRDLWSIFDFAEPGLLGGAARFARAFAAPIRAGSDAAFARLTRRVSPFLLRRTKRDPEIARDLPEKQEQDVLCELHAEQAALYRAMAEAALQGLVDKTGMQRRAHILTALLRLKQICNHPESFTADEPDKLFGRSGKLDRLAELLEELIEEGQPALVFTQFTEMGALLQRAVELRFDVRPPLFHGGLSAGERDRMVAEFQSDDGPPLLVLSLRAGGTGLNLTRATAVIHYDRWWNPAVEDQATDRAHRIGQRQRVNVYKLVTRGTIEERVQRLLADKRELARKVLAAAGDDWVTELSDEALRDLFQLGDLAAEDAEEAA